jgi:hypothetical protein
VDPLTGLLNATIWMYHRMDNDSCALSPMVDVYAYQWQNVQAGNNSCVPHTVSDVEDPSWPPRQGWSRISCTPTALSNTAPAHASPSSPPSAWPSCWQ